jgi:hypothetical protein
LKIGERPPAALVAFLAEQIDVLPTRLEDCRFGFGIFA